jgi:hypothetical protein
MPFFAFNLSCTFCLGASLELWFLLPLSSRVTGIIGTNHHVQPLSY